MRSKISSLSNRDSTEQLKSSKKEIKGVIMLSRVFSGETNSLKVVLKEHKN